MDLVYGPLFSSVNYVKLTILASGFGKLRFLLLHSVFSPCRLWRSQRHPNLPLVSLLRPGWNHAVAARVRDLYVDVAKRLVLLNGQYMPREIFICRKSDMRCPK